MLKTYLSLPGGIEYVAGFKNIAATGVGIFYILAGYYLFLKKTIHTLENLKKKARTLLIPFAFCITLYTVVNCIAYYVMPGEFDNFISFSFGDWIVHLLGIPFWECPLYYEPLWFLRDLFILNCLSGVIEKVIENINTRILVLLLLTIWMIPIIPYYLKYSIVFFMIGSICGYFKSFPYISKKAAWLVFMGGFVGSWLSDNDIWTHFCILLLVFSTFSIFHSGSINVKTLSNRLLPYSLFVYLTHYHVQTVIQKVIARLYQPSTIIRVVLYFALPVLVIGFCLVTGIITRYICPHVFGTMNGNRNYEKRVQRGNLAD